MQSFRCHNCGGEGEPKTVVQDRADCSFGEVTVCPDCGSDDIVIERPVEIRLSEENKEEIEAKRIIYGEIAELQELAKHIEPGDALLLEWAVVVEGRSTTTIKLLIESDESEEIQIRVTKEKDN
jgi:NAD-dependent SIR2 family protein deacetylase